MYRPVAVAADWPARASGAHLGAAVAGLRCPGLSQPAQATHREAAAMAAPGCWTARAPREFARAGTAAAPGIVAATDIAQAAVVAGTVRWARPPAVAAASR